MCVNSMNSVNKFMIKVCFFYILLYSSSARVLQQFREGGFWIFFKWLKKFSDEGLIISQKSLSKWRNIPVEMDDFMTQKTSLTVPKGQVFRALRGTLPYSHINLFYSPYSSTSIIIPALRVTLKTLIYKKITILTLFR